MHYEGWAGSLASGIYFLVVRGEFEKKPLFNAFPKETIQDKKNVVIETTGGHLKKHGFNSKH